MMPPVLLWLRKDLRLHDNPALVAAAQTQQPILPVYIQEDNIRPPGGASRWWLHHSLAAFDQDWHARTGGHAWISQGRAADILPELMEKTNATGIFWNRRYAPYEREIDQHLKDILPGALSFKGNLLFEPWEVRNGSGGWYKVFTPFWKAALIQQDTITPVQPVPALLTAFNADGVNRLADLDLLPTNPNWAAGWAQIWQPGEAGAHQRLDWFFREGIQGYKTLRNRPDMLHTSRLSPHLAFGEISPREIYHQTQAWLAMNPDYEKDATHFISEIGWREFSYNLLYYLPNIAKEPLQPQFKAFPWEDHPQWLTAWQQGQTGFPIVDAAMRELWQTGWMHNRCRMIVGSFLVKNMLMHWHHGEEWFWDTLVDADVANNSASWQWVSGCGADAAPYFRIFNPIMQGEKFDPDGTYVRQWVPELQDVPLKYLHQPWEMPIPPAHYPAPLMAHSDARQKALAAYEHIKKN